MVSDHLQRAAVIRSRAGWIVSPMEDGTMRVGVLVLVMAALGCGGMDPQPSCRTSGEACAVTADCCSTMVCNGGTCGEPCKQTGQACYATSGGGTNCCAGLTCTTSGCAAPSTCGGLAASCGSMFDCCQGLTCPRYGSTCAKGLIGDPCAENADCGSGICVGWCTKTCFSDAACGSTNYCIATSSSYKCFPFCQTNADCAIYPGTTCKIGSDPDGLSLPVCSS